MVKQPGRRALSRAATVASLALFASLQAMQEAKAATATANIAVSATVLSICSVVATPLAFGNYNASSGTPKDATADITATCTPGVGYTLTLDAGTTGGGSLDDRLMDGPGTATLSYDLYTANDYATIWGDGSGSTGTVADTGDGTGQVHTVYGRIPISQFVTNGAYTDTVQVTLTY